MVGWACSLIRNSPQNVSLIRQFALLGFVGRKEGRPEGWRAGPPTGLEPGAEGWLAICLGVALRGAC